MNINEPDKKNKNQRGGHNADGSQQTHTRLRRRLLATAVAVARSVLPSYLHGSVTVDCMPQCCCDCGARPDTASRKQSPQTPQTHRRLIRAMFAVRQSANMRAAAALLALRPMLRQSVHNSGAA